MNAQAAAQALQAAHAAWRRGDLDQARRTLAPALASHSNQPGLLHLHALVQRDSGDLEGAAATLAKAAEASGGSAEIRNTLGNVLSDLGRLDEADLQFEQALRSSPSFVPAWINRGQLASRRGRHEEAIALLERACALDPRSVLAHVSLGNAYRRAGDAEKAVEVLRKAVALNPAQPSTRVHLGVALRSAERPQEAIAEYDVAERSGVRTPQLLNYRGAAWLDLGEVERARADYDRLTAQFPGYLDGHRARARLYSEWDLAGDPCESFRRTAASFPAEASLWDAWVGTLISFRQYDEALETISRAEAAIGGNASLTATKAAALSELGRYEEADAAFEAAAPAFGEQPAFLNAQARHLLRRGEPDRCAAVTERALALDPDNQLSWAYLGTAWRVLGDEREHWLHDYDAHVAVIEAKPPGWSGSAADFANHAAPVLRGLHQSRAHPPDQTLRNGTQTHGALFDRREPVVLQIRDAVLAAAQGFIATMPDDESHPLLRRKSQQLDFSGSWSVRLTRHGFHINHVHQAGWISSAYYFALPPSDPADQANAGWLQLGAPPDEFALGLGPRRLVEPAVGTLALFPSSMWHGTIPFASEGERLTAAFDIVPAAR